MSEKKSEPVTDGPKTYKIQSVRLLVERGQGTAIPKDVPLYEQPIYELKFPCTYVDGAEGTFIVREDDVPDPNVEYQRLVEHHGKDENGQPIAQVVFGSGMDGVARLAESMQESGYTDVEVPRPVARKKK